MAVPPSRMPIRPIRSTSAAARTSVLASCRELWLFREVLWAFTARMFRLRYKQTLLGVAWVVLQPTLLLAVLLVVFRHIGHMSGGGVPYGAFALSSLICWTFVSSAVALAANALVADAGLLRKVYFPREIPVLGAIAAFTPDLGVGIVLNVLCAPLTGARPNLTLLMAPLIVVWLAVTAIGISLPIAALSVYYRDFRYVVPFGIQLWFFASPVAYPVTGLSPSGRDLLAVLNPIVGPMEGARRVLAAGSPPDWRLLGLSGASATMLTVVAYAVFKRFERHFADVV